MLKVKSPGLDATQEILQRGPQQGWLTRRGRMER